VNNSADFDAVTKAIRERRTLKVLSDDPLPSSLDKETVEDLLDSASWAPFHKAASREHRDNRSLNSMVPWRCYVLDSICCRELRQVLIEDGDTTKIPMMLASASTLLQFTWLPNPGAGEDQLFDPTVENMEHIAAGSAAIQNLLIAATARGIRTYWSSGGGLRKLQNLRRLRIPDAEIVLGSVFLFPPETNNCKTAHGKLRDQRGAIDTWASWVERQE
tara:strand:+ start:2449 stop:3102 length:654 start_codon:yes stop_codon:yes gene_type:complete